MEDLAIDIDVACFGHCVAEFEILCSSEADVPGALGRIKDLCVELGLAEGAVSTQAAGKFEMYVLENSELREKVLTFAPHIIEPFI